LVGDADSVRDPRDWWTVLSVLSDDVYTALADGHPDWWRPAQDYLRALVEAQRAGVLAEYDAAVSRMNMTAVVVRAVAPAELPDVWEPAGMVQLFLEQLPVTLDEARRLTGAQPMPPLADLIRLRRVKMMVNPLAQLEPSLPRQAAAAIRPWLELREHLP
jgi:hypothetical protein